jgi:hypothetical protein
VAEQACANIRGAVAVLFGAVDEALARCAELTGGLQADSMAQAVNAAVRHLRNDKDSQGFRMTIEHAAEAVMQLDDAATKARFRAETGT